MREVTRVLEEGERTVLEDTLQYDADVVGHHMTREWVAVPDGYTVQQVLDVFADATPFRHRPTGILVVDARNVLRGAVTFRPC